MASNRIGRKTAPGFADPNAPMALPQEHGAARPREEPAARPSGGGERARTPMVEVEVSVERGSAPRTDTLRRVYEVWTNNHVYTLDSRLQCLEVRTTGTNQVVADHPFLATRLVGGQLQTEGSVEMSYPLPRPGSFAVFEARKGNRRQFSRTSAVTRVVLRLRVVSVTDAAQVPSWEDVSSDN